MIATRASEIVAPSSVTTAVTPTTAISICRRYSNRTYEEPVFAAGAGRCTSRSSSLGSATVAPGPVQSAASGTVRSPDPDRIVTAPSKHSSAPPVSIAGDAFITFPPIVPCARVACEPTIAQASASAVNRSRTRALPRISSCVVVAPSRTPPPASAIPRSPSIRSIATIESGSGALPCRAATTRSVPPATTRAPVASADTASSTVEADVNVRIRPRPRSTRPTRAPASSGAGGRGSR